MENGTVAPKIASKHQSAGESSRSTNYREDSEETNFRGALDYPAHFGPGFHKSAPITHSWAKTCSMRQDTPQGLMTSGGVPRKEGLDIGWRLSFQNGFAPVGGIVAVAVAGIGHDQA